MTRCSCRLLWCCLCWCRQPRILNFLRVHFAHILQGRPFLHEPPILYKLLERPPRICSVLFPPLLPQHPLLLSSAHIHVRPILPEQIGKIIFRSCVCHVSAPSFDLLPPCLSYVSFLLVPWLFACVLAFFGTSNTCELLRIESKNQPHFHALVHEPFFPFRGFPPFGI